MATLAKARRDEEMRVTIGRLWSRVTIRTQPPLHFHCKVEKERLSLTIPASERITLALIGAWHNSLDRMPAVILTVSPLLNIIISIGL